MIESLGANWIVFLLELISFIFEIINCTAIVESHDTSIKLLANDLFDEVGLLSFIFVLY